MNRLTPASSARLKHGVGLAAALLTLLTTACDPLTPEPGEGNPWKVLSDLSSEGAVTAMAAASSEGIIAVGGRSRTSAPLVWRVTATTATSLLLPTGVKGVLRGVAANGSGAGIAVGDEGLVLGYSSDGDTLASFSDVPTTIDFRGVSSDGGRYWLVGQELRPSEEPPERGVVMKLEGTVFTRVTDLPAGAEVGGAFQAVWTAADGTTYVVGSTDEILISRGGIWTATPADNFRLNAIHGNGVIVVAVGGRTRATVLEDDGSGFRDISPTGAPVFYDVHVSADGVVTAVGGDGSIWERRGSTWRSAIDLPATLGDVLALHVDARGRRWAGGGQSFTSPMQGGFFWFSAAPATP